MSVLRVAYDQNKGVSPLPRRTLSDVFSDAAKGLPPRQPHADADLLITEAFIAQESLRKIGKYISHALGCQFELGPAKDIDRAQEKTAAKIQNSQDTAHLKNADGMATLANNCDFSRGRGLLNDNNSIKKAIDLLGQRGPITLTKGQKSVDFYIVDVDNSFSNPNPKKANLRNLDIKIAIPIVLRDGSETYHICEVQFIPKGAKKAYAKSEESYKVARREMIRMQFLENSMDICPPESAKDLEKSWKMAQDNYVQSMEHREKINLGVVEKYGLDDLIGYQPCNFCGAKNLAKAQVKPI